MEPQKTPNNKSKPEKEEQSWRSSHTLISNYITKLRWSEQHGTGTKADVQSSGTE